MTMEQDARIPIRFGSAAEASAETALLIEEGDPAAATLAATVTAVRFALPATSQVVGCACCLPRGPVSTALGRLFLARARAEVPLFDAVVAVTHSAAGRAAVLAALDGDVLTRARFRLAPDQFRG
jgi:hypothetical protein